MKKYTVFLLLILLIIVRYFSSIPVYKNGDSVRITATVFSDPMIYTTSQGVKVGGLITYLPTFTEISYSDKIVVEGVVDNRKLDNPKLISDVESQSFGSGIRKKIVDFYQQVLPQTMSGLIAGVTLGNRGAIMSDFWQKIKSAGVVYMASASGVIIALFISFLIVGATYFLPRRKAIPFVIFGQFNI